MLDFRFGQGFDAHRLIAGRKLILGGVTVPYAKGLDGHSDADALAHAVIDAVLGATALGDIGQHFPPGDPRYKNADSLELLARVVELAKREGYAPAQLDATVIAEQPRLAPYIPAMRRRLAAALGLQEAEVSVKATTSDGLGAIGRGEGIGALAAVIMKQI